MFLVLGIVGLLSVQAQLIAVGIIRNNAQDQAASSVSGFANLVRGQINSVLTNTSTEFADGSNAVLQGFQNGINNDMVMSCFGWSGTKPLFPVTDEIAACLGSLAGSISRPPH